MTKLRLSVTSAVLQLVILGLLVFIGFAQYRFHQVQRKINDLLFQRILVEDQRIEALERARE